MKAKIGKYSVEATSVTTADGYQGSVMLTWEEGSTTNQKPMHFDKVLPTSEDAEKHALQQVQLRVQDGAL